MLSCITQKHSSIHVGYKTGFSDVYIYIYIYIYIYMRVFDHEHQRSLLLDNAGTPRAKFMHDLPNVQMLLSATKECFIRELFGNQLPPP